MAVPICYLFKQNFIPSNSYAVRLEALADTLPGGTQAKVIRTDVTVAADIARSVEFTVEQFGRLDIAFNNAGVSPKRAPLADLAEEAFDAALNTNVRGVFIAMKHEIRAMLKTGGGSIVNTGSVSSTIAVRMCLSNSTCVRSTKADEDTYVHGMSRRGSTCSAYMDDARSCCTNTSPAVNSACTAS